MRSTDVYSRQVAAEYGVTVPQLLCLRSVLEGDGLTVGELAGEVHLSQSTCVGILDRLEAKNLVRRERSARDRRVVHLKGTEEGRAMHERTPTLLQDRLTRQLEELPRREGEWIAASLEKVVEMMQISHVDASPFLQGGEKLYEDPPRPLNRPIKEESIS